MKWASLMFLSRAYTFHYGITWQTCIYHFKNLFCLPFNYHRQSLRRHWVGLCWSPPRCWKCYKQFWWGLRRFSKEQAALTPQGLNHLPRRGQENGKRGEKTSCSAQGTATTHALGCSEAATRPQAVDSGSEEKAGPKNTHVSVRSPVEWAHVAIKGSFIGTINPIIWVKVKEKAWENLMSAGEGETTPC